MAVATKAWVLDIGTVAAAGLTATEITTGPLIGGVPKTGSCPPPPHAASTKLQSSAISQGNSPAGRFKVVMEITLLGFRNTSVLRSFRSRQLPFRFCTRVMAKCIACLSIPTQMGLDCVLEHLAPKIAPFNAAGVAFQTHHSTPRLKAHCAKKSDASLVESGILGYRKQRKKLRYQF